MLMNCTTGLIKKQLMCCFYPISKVVGIVSFTLLLSLPQLALAKGWGDLTVAQQEILAPLESDWSSLSKDRQKKWVAVANRYPHMSDSEKNVLQSRMTEWAKLSTEQRRVARDNYLSTLKFPPEKKAEAWQAYQQLSEEDKKKLAEKKAAATKPSAVTAPTLK
jgi:hypothetical protein